jgi:KUP system potassium uptake protein
MSTVGLYVFNFYFSIPVLGSNMTTNYSVSADIGQAAYIAQDATKTAFTNPFFYTVIPGTFYFSLVIAVMATIVASQAMITGAFQLLSQIMKMSYFPHIKTVHTSKLFHGQIYMPLANWLLMIGCVIVTAVYSNVSLKSEPR